MIDPHETLHIRAERRIWSNQIALYIGVLHRDGSVSVANNITFSKHAEGAAINADRLLSFRPDEAQTLMDELWHCGLRPSEGSGSAGSLEATERHLKDMQSIAFNLLARVGAASK